jgi:hypothetical protein
MIKRSDIRGFTIKVSHYAIEFVFVKYQLKSITIWNTKQGQCYGNLIRRIYDN